MIHVIGNTIILVKLIEEIKQAKYYSILADEASSHNQEFLSLCVRFLDAKNEIREECIGFLNIDNLTGRSIGNRIVNRLEASNMSSEAKGCKPL